MVAAEEPAEHAGDDVRPPGERNPERSVEQYLVSRLH
jgi:hypothetical protein